MVRTNRNGPNVKSSGRIVRSVQTVSVANGPYSEHIRSVHLIMTYTERYSAGVLDNPHTVCFMISPRIESN